MPDGDVLALVIAIGSLAIVAVLVVLSDRQHARRLRRADEDHRKLLAEHAARHQAMLDDAVRPGDAR